MSAVAVGFVVCASLGDPVLLHMGAWLLLHSLCLMGGFLVHEVAHVLGMKVFRGVTHVAVGFTAARFSVTPIGRLYGWQIAVIAVFGPGAACAVGALLACFAPGSLLQYWFLLHSAFLLPVFGDGQALITGLKNRNHGFTLRTPETTTRVT
ncbi:hypothetical protein ACIQC5_05705 [Paenarthrobacter sp. NPDC092416]|uniref:hypothetical protein n=1 Tax=Paenarthrobacter sp. NPDC092416 TaxID=3364386 RepID=UPI003802C856